MRICIQILIVLIVSTLLAFVFKNIFGFYESIALFTVIQFIAPTFLQSITRSKQKIERLEGDINELVDLSTCNVQCPCGGYKFSEILMVSEESIISKCPVCNNEYRLVPEVKVILTTEPVNIDKPIDELTIKTEL